MKPRAKIDLAKETVAFVDDGIPVCFSTQVHDLDASKLITLYISGRHIANRILRNDNTVLVANYRDPIGALAEYRAGAQDVELFFADKYHYYDVLQTMDVAPSEKIRGEITATFRNPDARAEHEPELRRYIREFDAGVIAPKQEPETSDAPVAPAAPVAPVAPVAEPEQSLDDMLAMTGAPVTVNDEHMAPPRRAMVANVSLRHQYVLDEVQGSIMRENPYINRVLMGPAGTGKTTTMIKKLGINMDTMFSGIKTNRASLNHQVASWYMFTPTELLKAYLKESFAKEDVAAPDENVFVWKYFSEKMARDIGVLSTNVRAKKYIISDARKLKSCRANDLMDMYAAFEKWFADGFRQEIMRLYQDGINLGDINISNVLNNGFVVGRESSPFKTTDDDDLFSILARIYRIKENAGTGPSGMVKLDDDTDTLITRLKKKLFRDDNNEHLRPFMDKLTDLSVLLDRRTTRGILDLFKETYFKDKTQDQVRDFIMDVYAAASVRGAKKTAVNEMWNELIVPAVKNYIVKSMNATDLSVAKYLDFDRVLSGSAAKSFVSDIAANMAKVKYLVRLKNAFSNIIPDYFDFIISSYKGFKENNAQYYLPSTDGAEYISQDELDILVLAWQEQVLGLKNHKGIDKSGYAIALDVLNEYNRDQVFIDEVTDFSPIQLRIMYNLMLAHKKIFFATGDFNQTLTEHGTYNANVLKWAIPNPQIKYLERPYRQTVELTEFAQRLKGSDMRAVHILRDNEEHGVRPVLGYNMGDVADVAEWVKQRIGEVLEQTAGQLPSIAILVDSDAAVEPLAGHLDRALRDMNIRARACVGGAFLGEHGVVRVFCIDYIKGLEFESVFFVNVDKFAAGRGDLINNYLYVGASRAARFFGITVSGKTLPPQIAPFADMFVADWSE